MTSTSIKQYRRRSSCGTIALVAAAIMTSSTSASNQCHHYYGSVIPHRSSTLLSASIDREESRGATTLDRRLNVIDNPSVDKHLNNAVATNAVNSKCCNTADARIFFQEQQDLVSEILSFLDVQSLLVMCSHVVKPKSVVSISSLLRYDHIIQSALSSSNTTTDRRHNNSETTCNYNGDATSTTSSATITIMEKLIQVYHIDNNVDDIVEITMSNCRKRTTTMNTTAVSSSTSTSSSPSLSSSSLPLYLPTKQKPPSPLRLLQLVNGRNCEKCHCQLSPHVLAAGNNKGCSSGGIVLPSLSFGKFCSTQCIF